MSHRAADAAAAELGLSRRQVYALVQRWRQGPGLVTDLIPVEASQLCLADALGYEVEQPVDAGEAVAVMDRRTHEGVTTGLVTLPYGQVHVGVWFRLLRGVLDEVNAQISRLRRSAAKDAVRRVWEGTGLRYRAGQQQWRPFEALDGRAQDAMLEAAARAMYLVETGELPVRGPLSHLFRVPDYAPVPPGDPPIQARPANPWAYVMRDIEAMIDQARRDPAAAAHTMRVFATTS